MKTKRRSKTKAVKASPLDPLKDEFMILQPAIADLKAKLKEEKKKMSGIFTKVRKHMESEQVEQIEFCGFTFQFSTKEHCPFNEKNLEEVLEDKAIIELYKEKFSKSKVSFGMAKSE
jgi:hypothetical protein